MIKLKELFELIKNDREIDNLPINEQIDTQTYYFLAEAMDINKIYPYESTDKFFSMFKDDHNIEHFIRIMYQPIQSIPNAYVVKFGFYDQNNKVSYERPNVIYDLKPDEKIFNTHIHILINVFLDKFFEKVEKDVKLYLPATDYPRYRLYRIALNKFLDKLKYKSYDCEGIKNCIVIEKI